MSFAGETVTFVSWTLGARGTLGVQPEEPVEVDVAGCRFRPMTAKELNEAGFDAGLQVWKCTAPPVDAAVTIDDTGYLRYGDDMFAVLGGARPFTDMEGHMYKVTIFAQKPT